MRRILTPAMRLGLRVLQVVNREGLLSSREVSERLYTDARKTREVMIHLAKKGYLIAGRGCVGGYAMGGRSNDSLAAYCADFGVVAVTDIETSGAAWQAAGQDFPPDVRAGMHLDSALCNLTLGEAIK